MSCSLQIKDNAYIAQLGNKAVLISSRRASTTALMPTSNIQYDTDEEDEALDTVIKDAQ